MITQIQWLPVLEKMPDDEITVFIADVAGDVLIGFHDGDDGWRYDTGERVVDTVTHWAHIPAAPCSASSNHQKTQ